MKMVKKWHLEAIIMSLAVFFVAFSSFAAEVKLPKSIVISTHPKGSTFNTIGSAFAKVITQHTSITATDRPYAGYASWIPLVNEGKVDMGICNMGESYYAYMGQEPYKKKNSNLRLISSGNGLNAGFLVSKKSGIKNIADLKGKRVGFQRGGISVMYNQKTVLRAGGLDPEKDVIDVPIAGVTESLDAFAEGRIDASWASVGMGKVTEAAAKVGGVYWLSVSGAADDAAAKIVKEMPGFGVAFLKAGSWPGVENDVWSLDMPIVLVSHIGLSEEAAYLVTKAIYESETELNPIHPKLKGWSKHMVSEDAMIAYHPGAIRFYKEAGLWSQKMDQVQKKLLSQ